VGSYYTIGRGGHPHEKFFENFFLEFSRNDTSRGKKCGQSEFDNFEAKKRFPDSGKIYVLKRKVIKMRNCQIRILTFLPLKVSFLENFRKNFQKIFHVGGSPCSSSKSGHKKAKALT
jgi:hypothetical protein